MISMDIKVKVVKQYNATYKHLEPNELLFLKNGIEKEDNKI